MDITYIRAERDGNGNPRNGWLIETPKGLVFLDEGHGDPSVLYEWLGDAESGESRDSWHRGADIFHDHVSEIWKSVTVLEYESYKLIERMVRP
jgi:hypothetical protein